MVVKVRVARRVEDLDDDTLNAPLDELLKGWTH
jgi:hypothetical protein